MKDCSTGAYGSHFAVRSLIKVVTTGFTQERVVINGHKQVGSSLHLVSYRPEGELQRVQHQWTVV